MQRTNKYHSQITYCLFCFATFYSKPTELASLTLGYLFHGMLRNEDWFGQWGFFVVVEDRIPTRTTFFARVTANQYPSYDPPDSDIIM